MGKAIPIVKVMEIPYILIACPRNPIDTYGRILFKVKVARLFSSERTCISCWRS